MVWGPEWRQAIADRPEKGVSAAGGGSVWLKMPFKRRPGGALVASSCPNTLLLQPHSYLFSAPGCLVCPAAPIVLCS